MDTKLQQASNYHDLSELDKLRQQSKNGQDKEALQAAAKQFESVFMKMLLSSMRQASEVLESDSPFNSQSSKFYRDMHDQQLSMNLAETGSLGLADLIVQQLSHNDTGYTPASVLRGNGNLTQTVDSTKSPSSFSVTPEADKQALFESPGEFIEKLLPVAEDIAEEAGIDPMIMVAQAALETGWGSKVINKEGGESSHNLFGIKADHRWNGEKAKVQTTEYRDGVRLQSAAYFRAYDSVEDSMKDYVGFLQSDPRYSKALENGKDPAKYFESLQSAGYATDPNYAKKVISIMSGNTLSSNTNSRSSE